MQESSFLLSLAATVIRSTTLAPAGDSAPIWQATVMNLVIVALLLLILVGFLLLLLRR